MASSVAGRRSPALVLVFLELLLVVVSVTGPTGVVSKSFNIINNCNYTVWPGIASGDGSAAALESTGFELARGESRVMTMPSSGWSGRLWVRTLCSTDASTGKFTCVTGDCGSGHQECEGGSAAPPVTLAQFTLDGNGGMDLYDVSLVDGYNVPMVVAPPQDGARSSCAPTGCMGDLNAACPLELRVMAAAAADNGIAVACMSACLAFGSPQYCCTGAYGDPDKCRPSAYSELFKAACPRAVSYAYDGAGSTFTCAGGDTSTYTITLCPKTTSSGKPSDSPNLQPQEMAGNLPHIDGTTGYTGSSQVGAATVTSTPLRIVLVVGVLGAVTAALGVLAKLMGLFRNFRRQGEGGAAADTG